MLIFNPHDDSAVEQFEQLMQHATALRASDIHIEPERDHYRLRCRQDGLLYEKAKIPIDNAKRLCSRIKVLSQLDISEQRLAQDGRLLWESQQKAFDVRVNTCPTHWGEKIVMRILNAEQKPLSLTDLGLYDFQLETVKQELDHPHGMILVTGPTGSGKTATLYAALQYVNQVDKNICTVEDPIEIYLPGINQVQINAKIPFGFPQILRGFLRQDPDIVMIGEIRDQETAEIAVKAAQTGHLVLSSLHTEDAFSAISRLQQLGISEDIIRETVRCIIAQRLVRCLCTYCGGDGKSCEHCLKGYHGRTGIFEILSIAKNGLSPLKPSDDFNALKKIGLRKYQERITSLDELKRVIRWE